MLEIRDSDWLCDKVASITTKVQVNLKRNLYVEEQQSSDEV